LKAWARLCCTLVWGASCLQNNWSWCVHHLQFVCFHVIHLCLFRELKVTHWRRRLPRSPSTTLSDIVSRHFKVFLGCFGRRKPSLFHFSNADRDAAANMSNASNILHDAEEVLRAVTAYTHVTSAGYASRVQHVSQAQSASIVPYHSVHRDRLSTLIHLFENHSRFDCGSALSRTLLIVMALILL
jgi:hypothetical protein